VKSFSYTPKPTEMIPQSDLESLLPSTELS
jgi:hypothetical protein